MFTLPTLDYSLDALYPYLSEHQVDLHYNYHHKGYIDKLNAIIKNSPIKYQSPEDIVKLSYKYAPSDLFNNAAQVFNHDMYWKSMAPPNPYSHDHISTALQYVIDEAFGNLTVFQRVFVTEANHHFGSGWIWLVWNKVQEKLELITTHDAGSPIIDNSLIILFNCDLWEHSWYETYENGKEWYLKAFIQYLVNWKFAADNFEKRLCIEEKSIVHGFMGN
jgi:superoxide dismutase, Fe-Mn family